MLYLYYKVFFYNLKYSPTTFDKEVNNTVSNY